MTDIFSTLWEWQTEDVAKLRQMPNILNANEMGTGKTYEALAIDALRRQEFPRGMTLVICPMGSIHNTWVKWIREFNPEASIMAIDPKDRFPFIQALRYRSHDFYIVHWEALRLIPELAQIEWLHIIADEAHRAKNRKAQQTRALKQIKGDYKTALTGTPVTNRPHDFWSTLNWLYPKQFRSYWSFYKRYVTYDIIYPQGYHKVTGSQNEDELLEILEPFYVRHLKKARCCDHHPQGVMPWMPDKYYETVWVDLSPKQRKAYNEMNKNLLAWVGEHEDQPLIASVVIAKLIRLQQFALAYAEFEDDMVILSEPSAKLDALMEILEDNEDKQFVVFSQFSKAIKLLGKRLEDARISHALYTGDTSGPDRERIVTEFQAGQIRVFAGTIKAGGIGLDLFAASTVVFLDRDWSPANNLQAEDRLHRGGQKNAVEIIDIMARNTIDLGRRQILDAKWEWMKRMLGDTQKMQQEISC